MKCIWRYRYQTRCANDTKFLFCRVHFKKLKFFFISIPSALMIYYGVYNALIKPVFAKEELPNFLITINESIKHNNIDPQYTDTEPSPAIEYSIDEILSNNNNKDISKKQIQTALKEITDAYEMNNHDSAKKMIGVRFTPKKLNYDTYLGYIVAAYFGQRIFDKAANTVLLRNKYRKNWDYKLKLDLAKCIRYYTIDHTLNEGTDLVKALLLKYKSPLLSYVWTCVPYDILYDIEEGTYTSKIGSEINSEQINHQQYKYIISKYPNDPFIYYAYFLQGDFKKSLELKNNRIRNLCLFANGINEVKYITRKLNLMPSKNDEFIIPKDKKLNYPYLSSDISIGIKCLKEYALKYKNKSDADEAAFWLAWLYALSGNYYESAKWLNYGIGVGDGYFDNANKIFRAELINKRQVDRNVMVLLRSIPKRKEDENEKINYQTDEYAKDYESFLEEKELEFSHNINYEYYNKKSRQELIADIKTNTDTINIYNYLYALIQRANFDKATILFLDLQKFDNRFTNNINKDYNTILSRDLLINKQSTPTSTIIRIILANKNEKKFHIQQKRKLAILQINRTLKNRFLSNSEKEYLLYLKIRILVLDNPQTVYDEAQHFVIKYPKSKLADDVLAESIITDLHVIDFPERAIKSAYFLLKHYPNANACDNALNAIASYYQRYTTTFYPDWKENCRNAIKFNSLIVDSYQISSYKKKAKERISVCNYALNEKHTNND